MNFYKHHIGDYDAATAHLSWLEDMAYTRLMRLYYRREAPIPSEVAQACRLIRASTKQERDAVQVVLNEFFTLEADGWHNRRCDGEISQANESGGEREAKLENEKERQRRHRAERKIMFDVLREHGIVPPWDTKTEALREAYVRVTDTKPVTPVTRTATAIQTPDSRLQTNTDTKSTAEAAESVFDHWRQSWNHPGARLDDKRRKRIQARLKTFTPEDLRNAIEGFKSSPWHNGTDPKGTGTVYDGIETLLRDDAQVEKGLAIFRKLGGVNGAPQLMADGTPVRW